MLHQRLVNEHAVVQTLLWYLQTMGQMLTLFLLAGHLRETMTLPETQTHNSVNRDSHT